MRRIVYFGSWRRGAVVLQTLLDSGLAKILCVITDIERETGVKDGAPSLLSIAEHNEIAVMDGRAFTREAMPSVLDQWINEEGGLIGVSVGFNRILREPLLERVGVVNLHASLLPKYRGAAPELHAVLNGDVVGGVTAHWMVREVDAGPILDSCSVELNDAWTLQDLSDCYTRLMGELLLKLLARPEGPGPGCEQHQLLPVCPRIEMKAGYWSMRLPELRRALQHENS